MARLTSNLAFLLLSCIIAGCAKDVSVKDTPKVDVVFAGADVTKSVSGGGDGVSVLDVLVFRQDGGYLDSHVRADGRQVVVEVSAGMPVRYYVIANASGDAFDRVSDETRFRALFCSLEDHCDGVVMAGGGDGVFDGGETVTVSLDRLQSRVVLDKVTPRFLNTAYQSSVVKIERVFLVNVNGGCPYAGGPASCDVWYNRLGMEPTGRHVDGLLAVSHSVVLDGPSSVVLDDALYCCPNPVDNGVTSVTAPVWSVRNTRLVIELSIDGIANYYPVTLPAMSCNCSYVISEAVLLGPGSASPDVPVDRTSMSFSIQVNPWGSDDGHLIAF